MRFRLLRKKSDYEIQLERMIGFFPKNLSLYQKAFTHKSAVSPNNKSIAHNERLEFLGDAVLDSIIAHYLWLSFPTESEGALTQLKAKLVRRKTLNKLGQELNLIDFIQQKNNTSEATYGNTLEALIGAIYLDRGYEMAQKFVVNQLIPKLDIHAIMDTEVDFKSRVMEWGQKNKKQLDFVVTTSTSSNTKGYEVVLEVDGDEKGTGKASSKKEAEQLAAEQLYKAINQTES